MAFFYIRGRRSLIGGRFSSSFNYVKYFSPLHDCPQPASLPWCAMCDIRCACVRRVKGTFDIGPSQTKAPKPHLVSPYELQLSPSTSFVFAKYNLIRITPCMRHRTLLRISVLVLGLQSSALNIAGTGVKLNIPVFTTKTAIDQIILTQLTLSHLHPFYFRNQMQIPSIALLLIYSHRILRHTVCVGVCLS